jgi:hypothetical protein
MSGNLLQRLEDRDGRGQMKVSVIYGLATLILLGFTVQCLSAEGSIEISPKALVGCRSPEEPSCTSCCVFEGKSCTVMRWSSQGSSGVFKPWYNESADCPRCASCLQRDEQELRTLLASGKKCDCAKTKIGIDPCFAPDSCACYCKRLKALTHACPYRLKK